MQSKTEYTQHELALLMLDTMHTSFSGERCEKCERTANIVVGDSQWLCPKCGNVNLMSVRLPNKHHAQPEIGPSSAELHKAMDEARSIRQASLAEQRRIAAESTPAPAGARINSGGTVEADEFEDGEGDIDMNEGGEEE